MPKGNLIFPGELRGEKSFGMMCSPRELHLPNAPQKMVLFGIIRDQVVGTPFDSEALDYLGSCQYLIDQIEGNKMTKNVVITGALQESVKRLRVLIWSRVGISFLTGRRTDG